MEHKVKKLTVKYNGKIVGYLAELENGKLAFQYDEKWVKNGFSISPFSLPLDTSIRYGDKDLFGGLFGVFQDSLPDGWGELLVRRQLASKGENYDNLTPIEKLMLVGDDGLGALTYEPSKATTDISRAIDLEEVAKSARKVYDDEDYGTSLDMIYNYAGSSGGARPKAHIKNGNEFWIVKFACRADPDDIGKKEYYANLFAEQCGVKVNEFKLFDSEKCSGYFGSKRFDRDENGNRIHMVSLSSLLETTHRIPNLDYMHLFQVIQNICVSKNEDMYEAFRRMVFNVFFGNKDDHGKNFAFIYDENLKGYRLSPAYDLTKVRNKAEHEMTVNGNGNPTEEDMLVVAKQMKLSIAKCREIIKKTKSVLHIEDVYQK